MNKENLFLKIINETISDNSYLGNDCAYLKDLNLLISHDALIEDVHFKTSYFSPCELAKKALLVNISDILAGGGVPRYITVSLSGNLNEAFIKEFYKGLNETALEYGVKIIGGDLTGGDKIVVSISIIGIGNKNISSRKNAASGDLVYLVGNHGSSAMGLKMLLKGKKDKKNEFIKAHIEPELYPKIANRISDSARYPYVMMDTSDGLYDAMQKVSIASSVGFNIEFDKIPKKIEDRNLVLFGGEDFGLFICLKPEDKEIADVLELQQIGLVTEDKKILIDGDEIKEDKSFEHF